MKTRCWPLNLFFSLLQTTDGLNTPSLNHSLSSGPQGGQVETHGTDWSRAGICCSSKHQLILAVLSVDICWNSYRFVEIPIGWCMLISPVSKTKLLFVNNSPLSRFDPPCYVWREQFLQFIIIFRSFPMHSLLVSPAILLLKGQPNVDDQIHFFDDWTLLFDALNHLKSPSMAPFSLMLESLC